MHNLLMAAGLPDGQQFGPVEPARRSRAAALVNPACENRNHPCLRRGFAGLAAQGHSEPFPCPGPWCGRRAYPAEFHRRAAAAHLLCRAWLVGLVPALAVALGADLGSTFVVQALSYDLKAVVPVLMIGGVAAFMLSGHAMVRQAGRIAIGLALMILSLGMIVQASASLRGIRRWCWCFRAWPMKPCSR